MIKKSIVILIHLALIFITFSCDKKCYREITNEEISRLAYKGGEVVAFKSDSGYMDTLRISALKTTIYVKNKGCKDEEKTYSFSGTFDNNLTYQTHPTSFSLYIGSLNHKSKDVLYPTIGGLWGYYQFSTNPTSTSITVNGTQLSNVYQIVNTNKGNPIVDYLYYSFQYGIVKIVFADGSYWERVSF